MQHNAAVLAGVHGQRVKAGGMGGIKFVSIDARCRCSFRGESLFFRFRPADV
jgi:hypothetical protein